MAQSSEYPDLKFVRPRSWGKGRKANCPRVIVIHTTEGHERTTSAEDGAAYDARRTDGTSTHYFHDRDSTVQCVLTTDEAHAARAHGNDIGIQHELCGRAGQSDAQWADAASEGTLRQAARQVARDCRRWGIPAVKLTPAQVRAGAKGICGHGDITKAFPEDDGDHTDPGVKFPWLTFLALVKGELTEGDTVPLTDAELTLLKQVAKDTRDAAHALFTNSGTPRPAASAMGELDAIQQQLALLTAAVSATARGVDVQAALGEATETLRAQIQAVDEEVAERLGAGDPGEVARAIRAAAGNDERAEEIAQAILDLLDSPEQG